ncbi:hypothetical protein PCASD_01465 [Puccinia coronata f. sp. avenae]|uniref:Tyr recombinase domain-containing protein n=1 Tax=Puccinia coronata f. sp. avenae TaxID=200324 RepID=A0A2N5VKE0_9BASI|nr:hypothetical protein PCASD_01465 [Puccinia coronata f. sp. avenae]
MDLLKMPEFLGQGTEDTTQRPPDLCVLQGWKESMLISYNAAVKKFGQFMKSKRESIYHLPLTPDVIYRFVTWAGRGEGDNNSGKITAQSLTKYLHGLKAWHLYHNKPYPYQTKPRVKLMLKASGRHDACIPPKPGKAPFLIIDLSNLYSYLTGRGAEAEAVSDLAVVAFWGMARLAKLTNARQHGPIPYKQGLTTNDVQTYKGATLLSIYKAKTAKPGEIQTIKLRPILSQLCPVEAIRRHLAKPSSAGDSIFAAWNTLYRPKLSGHSFKVGGASLRHAVGVKIDDIKSLGRWTSDCYQQYIKPLSQEEVTTSLSLLQIPRVKHRSI